MGLKAQTSLLLTQAQAHFGQIKGKVKQLPLSDIERHELYYLWKVGVEDINKAYRIEGLNFSTLSIALQTIINYRNSLVEIYPEQSFDKDFLNISQNCDKINNYLTSLINANDKIQFQRAYTIDESYFQDILNLRTRFVNHKDQMLIYARDYLNLILNAITDIQNIMGNNNLPAIKGNNPTAHAAILNLFEMIGHAYKTMQWPTSNIEHPIIEVLKQRPISAAYTAYGLLEIIKAERAKIHSVGFNETIIEEIAKFLLPLKNRACKLFCVTADPIT